MVGGRQLRRSLPQFGGGAVPLEKFYQFVDGIFDVRCLVYFLTVILVFLFLTVQSLEKRRWSE